MRLEREWNISVWADICSRPQGQRQLVLLLLLLLLLLVAVLLVAVLLVAVLLVAVKVQMVWRHC
jgi:hypothetical protein